MGSIKGIQKAALLLTTLDPSTAMELLKGQSQETIQKIAMELSQMDAKGMIGPDTVNNVSKEFFLELQKGSGGGLHVRSFVNNLLQTSAGKEKAAELQAKMDKTVREKDPFIAITNAPPQQIAASLVGEPPQAVALVLSSLPSKLSTEILNRMDDELSMQVIWRMTMPQEVSVKTMRRIGEVICKRLAEMNSEHQAPVAKEGPSKEVLRKVALVLSGLQKEKRDNLLQQIQGRDKDAAKSVKSLMVTWEDIPKIDDKCLQMLLRKMEAGTLAKALFNADPLVSHKIRSNISERMAQMIDDETSLLGEPRKKDVLAAREEVANPLRDANESEELVFIEED